MKITLFLLLSFLPLTASAVFPVLGKVEIRETDRERVLKEIEARAEREFVDSLLNSIEVDSLTRSVYSQFPLELDRPKIFAGFRELEYPVLSADSSSLQSMMGTLNGNDTVQIVEYPAMLPETLRDPIPRWMKIYLRQKRIFDNLEYSEMLRNPGIIDNADWDLPYPPRLPEEDFSFRTFLRRLDLPEINVDEAILPEIEIKKRHWLHYFNTALQFSQAYVSTNWYQGGNDYLALLFNFTWNVDLNQVYHPDILFQSSLQYKLAMNSTPKGSMHKINTSQDLFQYSLKTGFRAFKHWFYSLNILFNTQFFDAYPDDSMQRTSSFLSPGTLNVGVGMTFNYENTKKTLNVSATISPLAYNLKTCIANDIDHEQFNIKQNRKTVSEIGSSAEINAVWKFTDNISWTTKLFLFTDYHYFLASWENTFNFQINKVLSTQLFLHPRYDSSSEWNTSKWHYWMFREILSFGISYTFATPK